MSEKDPMENPFKQKHKDQNTLKWCSWEILRDFPDGLTSQQIVEEIQRREYLDIKKNKNPSGQVAGDFVRNKTKFYRFREGVWTIRPYYMKWAEENPEEAAKLERELENKKVGKVGRPPKLTPTPSKRETRPRESKEKVPKPQSTSKPQTLKKERSNNTLQKSVQKKSELKEEEEDDQPKGSALVGKKAYVWWPDDKQYYAGVISSYNSCDRIYHVDYDDGDSEVLELVEYEVVKKGKAVMVHRSINHGNSSEETISEEEEDGEETETEKEREIEPPKKALKTEYNQTPTNKNRNIAGLSDSDTVSDEEVKKRQSKQEDRREVSSSKGREQKNRRSIEKNQDREVKSEGEDKIVKQTKLLQIQEEKVEDNSKHIKDEKDADANIEDKADESEQRVTRSEAHKLNSKPVSPKPDFIDSDTESEDLKQKQSNIKSQKTQSETEDEFSPKSRNQQQKKYIGRQALKRGRIEKEDLSAEENNDVDMDADDEEEDEDEEEEDDEEEEGIDLEETQKPKRILSFFENAQRGMLPKRDLLANKPKEKKQPEKKKPPTAGEVKNINQKKRQLSKQPLDYEEIRKVKRKKTNIVQIPTRKEPVVQILQRQQQPTPPVKPPPTPQYETPNQDNEEEQQSHKKRGVQNKSQSRSICSDSSESNKMQIVGDSSCLDESLQVLLSDLEWSKEALDFMTKKASSSYSGPPMTDMLKEFSDWPSQDSFAPFIPPKDFEGFSSHGHGDHRINTTSGQMGAAAAATKPDEQGQFLDSYIGGSIFICLPNTEEICLNNNIFAAKRDGDMSRMAQNSLALLFNHMSRKLYGIFEYAGQHGEKMEPGLVNGNQIYQVRVRPVQKFAPLHEKDFEDILQKQPTNPRFYKHYIPIDKVKQLYQRFLRNERRIKDYGINSQQSKPQSHPYPHSTPYTQRHHQTQNSHHYQSGMGSQRQQYKGDSQPHTTPYCKNSSLPPNPAVSGPQPCPQITTHPQHAPSQQPENNSQPLQLQRSQIENRRQENNLQPPVPPIQDNPSSQQFRRTQGETMQQGGSQGIHQIPPQNAPQSLHPCRSQEETGGPGNSVQPSVPPPHQQPHKTQGETTQQAGSQGAHQIPPQNTPQSLQPQYRSQEQTGGLGQGSQPLIPAPPQYPYRIQGETTQQGPPQRIHDNLQSQTQIPAYNAPQSIQPQPYRSQEETVALGSNMQTQIPPQNYAPQLLPLDSTQSPFNGRASAALTLSQVAASSVAGVNDVNQNSNVGQQQQQQQQQQLECKASDFGVAQTQEVELDELGMPPPPTSMILRPLSAPLLPAQNFLEGSQRFSGQVQLREEFQHEIGFAGNSAYLLGGSQFGNPYDRGVPTPPKDAPSFLQAASNLVPTPQQQPPPQQPTPQRTHSVFVPSKWDTEPYEFDDNSGPGLVWFDERGLKPSKQSQNKKLQNATPLPPFGNSPPQPPPQPQEPPPPPPQQQEQENNKDQD